MSLNQKLLWFYKMRDVIWRYPEFIDALADRLVKYYYKTRPFSHIVLISLIFTMVGSYTITKAEVAVTVNERELIEGVIIGPKGGPNTVNPVLVSDNPIEADLSAIIYEGLIRVKLDGGIVPVLAEKWEQIDEEGLEYDFYLRQDVTWHDGKGFSADDVVATFNILKSLGDRNYYSSAAEDITIEKVDEYRVHVQTDVITPTLFENLQWGVMPAHIIGNASPSTFSIHPINKNPVGTGPFELTKVEENRVILSANNDYYGGDIQLRKFTFVLFEDPSNAFEALQNGQIHQLANPPIEFTKQVANIDNITIVQSTPLYQIYWGLYFNLRDNGPEIFKSVDVRQAVSMAIDKERIINEVYSGAAVEAVGPIPEISWAFNKDLERLPYDKKRAAKLLEDNGWVLTDNNIREKDGVQLEFKLSHLDTAEKKQTVGLIAEDLAEIGVKAISDPHDADELRNSYVAPRNFEALYYGVETSIDPDRLDFFHEDAILPPGRNISSYTSDDIRTVFDSEGNKIDNSVVNIALQNAIASLDHDRRNGITVIDGERSELGLGYYKFQEVINEDAPVVFLFHPEFIYITRVRVKGVNLEGMGATTDRFLNIKDWYIEV